MQRYQKEISDRDRLIQGFRAEMEVHRDKIRQVEEAIRTESIRQVEAESAANNHNNQSGVVDQLQAVVLN